MEELRVVGCRLIRRPAGNGVKPVSSFFAGPNPDAFGRPYKLG